jgi:hypothetical protein
MTGTRPYATCLLLQGDARPPHPKTAEGALSYSTQVGDTYIASLANWDTE